MCAFDIAWSKINRVGDRPDGDIIPVTAFTFEAPRVGERSRSTILVQRLRQPDYSETASDTAH